MQVSIFIARCGAVPWRTPNVCDLIAYKTVPIQYKINLYSRGRSLRRTPRKASSYPLSLLNNTIYLQVPWVFWTPWIPVDNKTKSIEMTTQIRQEQIIIEPIIPLFQTCPWRFLDTSLMHKRTSPNPFTPISKGLITLNQKQVAQ
jgi:hypothetical protein